ncbi:hypothetical protein XNW1_3810001 [Xenorhabdus nematophila str. Websteri]|nr:hypothetical protein XNW1_3810001 [Xenorhabdus nematophila str. Websteri]
MTITFTNSIFMAKITAFPILVGLRFLITLTKSRLMILSLNPVIVSLMSTTFSRTGCLKKERGSGANPQLDEALPTRPDAMGKEDRKL